MSRNLLFYLMIPLLAFAALLQSTAFPRISFGGVKPDLVLILIIAGALIYDGSSSIGWAFVGGLALDIFSGGPLGASSLALMSTAFVIAIGTPGLSRYHLLVPLGSIFLGTLIYSFVYLTVLAALGRGLPLTETLEGIVLPALVYNTMVMLLLTPLLNRI